VVGRPLPGPGIKLLVIDTSASSSARHGQDLLKQPAVVEYCSCPKPGDRDFAPIALRTGFFNGHPEAGAGLKPGPPLGDQPGAGGLLCLSWPCWFLPAFVAGQSRLAG